MYGGLSAKLLCFVVAALSLLSSAALAQVQINQTFVPQGPSPIVTDQNFRAQGLSPFVSLQFTTTYGAVQAILPDPMLGPDTMFIGSTSGGIWETTDGGTKWTPLTVNQASLSIASLGLNTMDPTGKTLIAGVGITTSGDWGPALSAGAQSGLLYSTDGGKDWTSLAGAAAFAGQSVIGVAARGSTIMAATFEERDPSLTQASGALYGLYISNNGGQSFNLVKPSSGLPSGPVTSLVADPSSSTTFYAAVTSPTTADGGHPTQAGVYVTTNSGSTWSPVFTNSTMATGGTNVITGTTDQLVLKLAAGPNNSVAIAVVDATSDTLKGLYLSQNASVQNPSWSALALPFTNPGTPSGLLHLAVAIDPKDTSIVYVAGWDITNPPHTVPAFRVQGQDVTSLTCQQKPNGDCNTSGPIGTAHADARALVVNPVTGNLLMVGDGGIYVRTNPQSNNGAWTGLNTSTLQVSEPYAVAYGANAHRLVVAVQDNGVAIQSAPNSPLYDAVQGGDGHVALVRDVNDKTFANQPVSVYYTSSQSLSDLARLVVGSQGNTVNPGTDPAGVQVRCKNSAVDVNFTDCGTATGGTSKDEIVTVALNRADPERIALSSGFDVYVAQDNAHADANRVDLTLTDLSNGLVTLNPVRRALAYGASDNADVLLAGGEGPHGLYLSTTAATGSLTQVTAYKGEVPTSLVFGESSQHFYVADSVNLWAGTLSGTTPDVTIKELTSNLPTNIIRPTSVEFINNNGVDALLVGGLSQTANAQSQIAVADSDNGNLLDWRLFGSGLPNVLVYQMAYNSLADVLAIAAVGRGVWTLYDVTSYFQQATVLQFGLANNDSMPDASYLTDGKRLDGTVFVRPLDKYGTGTLTIAGNASYTGGTTILDGILQLGTGGASGAILGDVSFCGDATNPLCNASTNKFLVFDRSDTYTFAGAISGPGELVQTGTGTTILTGFSTYTGPSIVNSGALEVNGSITSSVFVNAGGTLAGTGTVGSTTVLTAGTLLPGNGVGTIGTLKVAGDLLFEPGSFYLTTVAGSTASSTSVTGKATLAGTDVSVFQPGSLINTYMILSAAGGRTGMFDMFTPIGLPSFVSASLGYTATDVTLGLTSQIAQVGGLTRNERAVGGALDQAFNAGGGIPGGLNAALFGLSAGELPSALDALSGEVHATTTGVLVDDSRYERDAILGRMIQASYGSAGTQVAALGADNSVTVASLDDQAMGLAPRGTDYAAPRLPAGPDLAFWTRAFGAWASFDGNGNAASASRQLGGFVSGMDAGVGGGWRLGAATGFNQSNINVDARHSSADVNTVYLAAYAGGSLGPVALRSGGAWGWNDIDTSRAVVFPGFSETEQASYSGDTGQVFGEAAYPMLMGSAAIEPFAGLAFVHVSTDSFHEQGGVAALRGASEDEDVGYSTLGLRAATTWHLSDMLVTPHASAAWQHAFANLTPDAALAFLSMGTGFAVTGVPLAQDSALIDVGLDLNLRPTITLGVSYAGQFANDLQDNAVKGRFTWLF